MSTVCNVGKGKILGLYNRVVDNDPADAAFVVMLLKVAEVDATLEDHTTFATLLAGANTEADFTNYVRAVLTDAELAALPSVDHTGNSAGMTLPDWVIVPAGGALDNSLMKIVVGYSSNTVTDTDADIIPLLALDITYTTSGNQLTIDYPVDVFKAT